MTDRAGGWSPKSRFRRSFTSAARRRTGSAWWPRPACAASTGTRRRAPPQPGRCNGRWLAAGDQYAGYGGQFCFLRRSMCLTRAGMTHLGASVGATDARWGAGCEQADDVTDARLARVYTFPEIGGFSVSVTRDG
jgi:hypothetical protein